MIKYFFGNWREICLREHVLKDLTIHPIICLCRHLNPQNLSAKPVALINWVTKGQEKKVVNHIMNMLRDNGREEREIEQKVK